VTSTGWQANVVVTGILHSATIDLGTLMADDAGTVTGAFQVPADVESGQHTLELSGHDALGQNRTVIAAITISDTAATAPTVVSTSGLIRTGTNSLMLFWAGTSAIGAGAMLLIAGNRRQRLLHNDIR
jgi:hypothetical protein